VLVLGLVSVLFFQLPRHLTARRPVPAATGITDTPAPALD